MQQGCSFFHHSLAISMTKWAKIFTGLFCYANVGIHQVRVLVFDKYQTCPQIFYRKITISLVLVFKRRRHINKWKSVSKRCRNVQYLRWQYFSEKLALVLMMNDFMLWFVWKLLFLCKIAGLKGKVGLQYFHDLFYSLLKSYSTIANNI